MKQGADILISQQEAAQHGIITDRQRLVRSRHWASRLDLFSKKAASSALLGNTRSRFRGRGMEFEEVRRYQPGDDIRTIDWKVSARNRGTYTKLFREERERPCHIIVDQRSSLFFGSTRCFKSVLAAELAVALAWAGLAASDRVGAQVIGDHREFDTRARNSRKAVLTLIDHVHTLNTQLLFAVPAANHDRQQMSHYLEECLRIIRPGTAVFVISDFYDFDALCAKTLTKIGRHADITLLHVFDPLEESLPEASALPISNGRETANIHLSKEMKNAYRHSITTRENRISDAAIRTGAHIMRASTAMSAREALTRLYQA